MVVKYIVLSISLLLLMTCDKEETDCAAVLCAEQTVSIEFIDGDGNNLIANNTYSLEDIKVYKGEFQMNTYPDGSATSLTFFLSGKEGGNSYQIQLSDTQTNNLILNLSTTNIGGECCGPTFKIINATYNGSDIEIIEENLFVRITVVVS